MAAASRGNYKRMYSWWWDSHISPKNSKWLQENLTDMDVKVKHMIKLLEEDGDSFAKKAEMYYKKRPELMKLVEEFYRAYRALAERYDHATGVLRQAHRTMAEAFPNQVPLDDSPSDSDPRTPEMNYLEESDSLTRRKGSKHFDELFGSGDGLTKFGEGRARKGLNFQDSVEKEQNNGSHDRFEKDDSEISSLKKVLAKLEAEKEASLVQYRESLERISKLELEVSNEQQSSGKLNDRARKAEDEVKALKESLEKLETECKTNLLRYQQSLDKMSNLESDISRVEKDGIKLSERASKAETEVEDLKQELSRVEAEKEAAHVRHQQCLEKISNLEKKLSQAEEDARKYKEEADKAESELITLREALKKLKEENEAEALKYQQCMEKIAGLELTINYSKEEAEKLQLEIDNGITKIKGAEEKCLSLERSNQTLQSELDSLMLKMGQQNQELTEKQQELGRLWSGMQEEHSRFVEAETAFQTLQHLHLKSEEELKLLGAEIQNRDQTLKNLESHNQSLDDQVQKVMGENMALNELNLSSALSIKNLQDEISRLKVTIGNIEAEVELRVNERNALQQEIYCLKEEINDLNKKNGAMIKQVEAVGYEPECFESSVKELQAENKTLKANFEEERSEKEGLLQKLTVMKELRDKNLFLENSISDMNVEIEELREKVKLLEGSCQFLMEEKATLVAEKDILTSHLQTTTENLEKLTNKSMFLENSLSDANAELEEFRTKAKSLEDLCLLLDKEKSGLITKRDNVRTELETSQKLLKDAKERFAELEGKHSVLVGEKESSLRDLESLQSSLDSKRQEHFNFAELSKTRLADLELQNRFLRDEGQDWKNQYEEELDRAINSHMEIFILQKCLQDMEEESLTLQLEHRELLEASIQSEKSISELERGSFEKDLLAKTSAETITILRSGLEDMENSLLELCDEKFRMTIEKFVIEELLEKLRLEAGSIMAERITLDRELMMQNEEFRKVSEMNEELRSKVAKGEIKEENLISEMENLSRKLHNLEEEHQNLQAENFKALDENCFFAKEVQHLKEENFYMLSELTYQTQLSLIFREIISEKCVELKDLGENLDKLHFMNGELEENVRNLEGKLGGVQIENLELEKSLEKLLKGLHEAEERQVLMEREKSELHNVFDELKAKNNEFVEIQEGQGKKILKLSEDNNCLAKETLFLREMKHNLEAEVQNLQEEVEQNKMKNETLSDELEKNKSEAQLWETQAAEFLSELQISAVREVLFAEKIHEFTGAFESLQEKCDSKEKEVEIHAERGSSLEEEIERLNIELGSYIPAIKSLNDSITSLEEHTIKSKMEDKPEAKDSDFEKCDLAGSCAQKYDDRISSLQSGSDELQGLLQRLLAIELAVIEAEKLSTKEKLNAKDEMKSGDALPRENGDISGPATPQHIESEAGNEVSTKDIVLDENSECSSYGISRRETSEVDGHILADYHLIEACKKPQSKHSSTESLVEKELGVDKLEISSRFSEPDPEVKKRKIIEGLEADAAKLTNLQTTVQDLKRKVEGKEKNRKGKVSEYDSLKGKLEEADEAIARLFNINRKLTKNVQDDALSDDQKSSSGPDELGRIRSRRISEQARKGSEKIGRLQLEMDKLQFILLKLEDEIQMRDRARAVDRQRRVLLRDYLYGETKGRRKSKRGMFCACLNPPTGGD